MGENISLYWVIHVPNEIFFINRNTFYSSRIVLALRLSPLLWVEVVTKYFGLFTREKLKSLFSGSSSVLMEVEQY